MAGDLNFLTALAAGAISFLSPCVLPLVPPYLGYMAGVSIDTLTGDTTDINSSNNDGLVTAGARRRVIFHSLLFVLGFSTVFIALGASATSVGQWLRVYQDVLAQIAGVIIIIMGFHFLGLLKISLLYREARFRTNTSGRIGSYVMGVAFAFGWTPCIGPVLGAILALAGSSKSVADGAILLTVYSAGLGIPFILAAIFIGPFMKFLSRFKKHLGVMEKIMGGFLVLTGILFLTGGMEKAAFWLIETFPVLATFG